MEMHSGDRSHICSANRILLGRMRGARPGALDRQTMGRIPIAIQAQRGKSEGATRNSSNTTIHPAL